MTAAGVGAGVGGGGVRLRTFDQSVLAAALAPPAMPSVPTIYRTLRWSTIAIGAALYLGGAFIASSPATGKSVAGLGLALLGAAVASWLFGVGTSPTRQQLEA
ncbi:hypothetical protein, partial [Xanthomonas phaseoli]